MVGQQQDIRASHFLYGLPKRIDAGSQTRPAGEDSGGAQALEDLGQTSADDNGQDHRLSPFQLSCRPEKGASLFGHIFNYKVTKTPQAAAISQRLVRRFRMEMNPQQGRVAY